MPTYGAAQKITIAVVTPNSDGTLDREGGVRVQFAKAGRVTKCRYQRSSGSFAPQRVAAWRSTGTKIEGISDANTGAGWFEVTWSSPILVTAGEILTFSIGNAATSCPRHLTVQTVTSTTDCTFLDYRSGSTFDVMPATAATRTYFVEPTFEPETVAATVTDDFNRANTTEPVNSGVGLGAAWDAPAYKISGNTALRNTGGLGSDYARHLTPMGSADHYVEVDVSGQTGVQNDQFNVIFCRSASTSNTNAVLAYVDPSASRIARIGRVQGGSFANIAAGSTTLDCAGVYKLRLECEGTTARFYHRGVLVLTTSIAGLTGLGLYTGFNCNPNASPYDNFAADDLFTPTVLGRFNGQDITAMQFGSQPVLGLSMT